MMNSKCKTCGRAKEGCGAWLNEKSPSMLYNMCESASASAMDKAGELANAGMDIRYKVGRLGLIGGR